MHHVWWQVSFMPGEGVIVRRFEKRGSLFGRCTVEYTRLTHREAMDVLDADSTAVLVEAFFNA